MAELNASEAKALTIFAKALADDNELKAIFCQCWQCFKKLLELLAARVPLPLKLLIEAAIRIGDQAHATVCG